MQGRTQRAAAVGAAAFVLAGSAALALPGTATAETKSVPCGGSVTAKPGDKILGTTPLLGIPLDLGIVTEGTKVLTGTINAVLGTVCKVTVTVVDTVVAPVPVVGEPAAGAINNGVAGTTNALSDAAGGTANALTGGGSEPAPQNPPEQGKPAPQGPSASDGKPGRSSGPAARGVPAPNSPVLGGAGGLPGYAGLPISYGTGYAAMRDYSGIPMATAGLFAPSPGVRYGGQIPGYSPEFGILGESEPPAPDDGVRNAGQAQALPGSQGDDNGATLPLLLAVLALSGVSAALVRTWVLRKAVG
ncbi:hypothetical protein SAMN05216266_101526 [Amycolatopsis marina]|uniref:Uncharacterized protein n=1 Tax=Amycolatopsis marina TaxID=490629 RepID=A0A1I0VW45_9PSEU|nr:hypothetical protein [Amycolatopsis marina]SFA80307.1 hypothetical protein SAMN05216266_101526 [Amycolatopsis marina]